MKTQTLPSIMDVLTDEIKDVGANAVSNWTDAMDHFHHGWRAELAANVFSAMYAYLRRQVEAHNSDNRELDDLSLTG